MTAGALSYATAAAPQVVYPASDSEAVRIVGRTLIEGNDVSFDWSGTYAETILDGRQLDLKLSGTGRSWFDVSVDGKPAGKFGCFSADTTITVASGLKKGQHRIEIRKRTEGETGRTTFHSFIVPAGATLKATQPRSRHIEFIGNSLSAGFGTEGLNRDEPFTPENENCNLAYSTIVPRYFDADYTIIAHSGRGVVRNYGDSVRMSKGTMTHKFPQVFDMDTTYKYNFVESNYKPDLVVVNLGANDFSTEPHPYKREFQEAYTRLLNSVIDAYGKDVKIMCVIPYAVSENVEDFYPAAIAAVDSPNIRLLRMPTYQLNSDSDRGAVWHPNYQGQQKIAMSLIPYVATLMDWPLTPTKPIQ